MSCAASFGFILLLLLSGLAAADSHTWTTQADFQSGALANVNATAVPGSLELAQNASAFSKSASNPVFGPGASGSWEQSNINNLEVLYDGGLYKMWYAGCTSNYCELGYATSPDGLAWTRYSGNPVINSTPGAWDANIGNPRVIHDGSVYKMWFVGDDLVSNTRIGYATSPDGIHWTLYSGNPIFNGTQSWDYATLTAPYVIHSGSVYTMWFAGRGPDSVWRIGRATSPDGINWTEDAQNPVLSATLPYEGTNAFPMTILSGAAGYEMYYNCGPAGGPGIVAHAVSSDGRTWTKVPLYAILGPGPAGSWDQDSIGVFRVLDNGTGRMLWYIGYSTDRQVGFAGTPGYAAAGTFTSSVFDSGSNGTTWAGLQGNATVPAATALTFAARTGSDPQPDATWSPWSPEYLMNGSLAVSRSRYIQLRATLTTSDARFTPVLQDVTLTYTPDRVSTPTPLAPPNGAWTANATVNVSWSFNDPDPGDYESAFQLQVSADSAFANPILDTGAVSGSVTSDALNSLGEGTWYWHVRTADNWGVWSPYAAASTFKVDRSAPTVTTGFGSPFITIGTAPYLSARSLVYLNASDGPQGIGVALVLYSIDSGFPTVYTVPFRVTGTDGEHFIRYTASDFLGNTLAMQTLNVYLDNTGPTTVLSASPSGSEYSVTASATDAGSGVASVFVSVDDGPWTAYPGALTLGSAGTHTIQAYAVDRLGNVGATDSITIVIPNVQPYIAGAIGVAGLVLGILLSRARKGGPWAPAAISAVLGAVEVTLAAASAGAGVLGIPPWPGPPILIDAILALGIAVAAVLHWRGRSRAAATPPPTPPPGPE